MVRRRANGEGTVNERADGRWEARWTDNQGQRRSAYGKTQREALRKMREARSHEDRGLAPLSQDSTVERFLRDWLEHEVRPNREPWTYDGYDNTMRVHVIPEIGRLRLDQVTPSVVQALVAGWRKKGLADGTVWKHHLDLKTAFSYAVKMKLVAENPVKAVTTPRPAPRVESIMTEDEVREFCRAIRGDRDEGIYLLGLVLGLRMGEVLGLSWLNIDLNASEARIVQQLQRQTGKGLVIKPVKTGRKGVRTVPLPPRLIEALWARKMTETQDREARWLSWRSDLDKDQLVFRSRAGTGMEPTQVRSNFARALGRVGFEPRRFHDLRHNAATILFGQGVSAKLVQELLGHANIGITMDLYTHVPRGALGRAIEGWKDLMED